MKRIRYAFLMVVLFTTLLWSMADTLWPVPFNYFSFRHVFVQYSGVIAIVMMSIVMFLALRPRLPEKLLGGLDKIYRFHKWLGIGALIAAILHWWFAKGTKWMVGWGWLEKPAHKGPKPELHGVAAWLHEQGHLAEDLGEWAFYIGVILLVMALYKKLVPYRLFRQTHKWMLAIYLVLAYHTVILTDINYWAQPIGWLLITCLLVGSIAAVQVLAGRIGKGRQYQGVIASLKSYPGIRAIEGVVKMQSQWPGHTPGQFAFVTSSFKEGAHPYSIASAWNPQEANLSFVVKNLGDWTAGLSSYLKEGMPVIIEGPYGCFDFEDKHPVQIWVAAGIGITPFIARMKYLASAPDYAKKIYLFHTSREVDQTALDRLMADAAKAGVELHFRATAESSRFTAQEICELVTDWWHASVWFCGPTSFGTSLRNDFAEQGISPRNFHQELFEMR